jgi:glycosyltransferase involved in cell wall biosynthesis
MKRILYLEHNVDGTVGGSHFCLLEICRSINREKFHPIVCFFQENTLIPDFKQAGADVVLRSAMKPIRLSKKYLGRMSSLLQAGMNMVRALFFRTASWCLFIRQRKIDLVHINNACGYDHDLMLAAWLMRIPCVVHERGIQTSLPPATHFFSNRIDGIITISDAVNRNLVNKGIRQDKLIRIDDGIDPSRLAQEIPVEQLRHIWGIPAQAPVIGIVGNIKPWKGQETVVRALIHLKKTFPGIRCFLIGSVSDIAYKKRLDEVIDEYGLHDTVIYTGYQKRPSDLIALFNIFIHASIDPEPFGIVLLEAMGKGKPVIATNIGGPLEILVDGETGYLTRPGDDKGLADRITSLLNNSGDQTRMGQRAKERLYEKYTMQINIRKIESLYGELLGA